MSARFNPVRLDLRTLAQVSPTLSGEQPLAALGRLCAEAAAAVDGRAVRWTVTAEWREPRLKTGMDRADAPVLWLHLNAEVDMPLTCQRCLGPVPEALEVDRWFRFVADEAAAEAQDDDCDEDLLALEPRPDMLAVLEDELLMSLPLVPMHDTCPEPVPLVDPASLSDTPEERPHPFAQLARLKSDRQA